MGPPSRWPPIFLRPPSRPTFYENNVIQEETTIFAANRKLQHVLISNKTLETQAMYAVPKSGRNSQTIIASEGSSGFGAGCGNTPVSLMLPFIRKATTPNLFIQHLPGSSAPAL